MEQSNESPYIWHLVAFSESFIKAYEVFRKCQDNNDRKALEEFKKTNDYNYYLMGGRLRGTFSSKEKLVEVIESENDPWGICEGWYTYLLVEKHYMNLIDSCSFQEDGETWYKFTKIDEDNWKYLQIEKPEYLKGIVAFA